MHRCDNLIKRLFICLYKFPRCAHDCKAACAENFSMPVIVCLISETFVIKIHSVFVILFTSVKLLIHSAITTNMWCETLPNLSLYTHLVKEISAKSNSNAMLSYYSTHEHTCLYPYLYYVNFLRALNLEIWNMNIKYNGNYYYYYFYILSICITYTMF